MALVLSLEITRKAMDLKWPTQGNAKSGVSSSQMELNCYKYWAIAWDFPHFYLPHFYFMLAPKTLKIVQLI